MDQQSHSAPATGADSREAREGRADLWELGAGERERLADERERLADEREMLANERERLADEFERTMDRRARDLSTIDADEAIESEEAQEALDRAEAAVDRAVAKLQRVRNGAARDVGRQLRQAAGHDRARAAGDAASAVDQGDQAWLADRRDFVATERDTIASRREQVADERDEIAGARERRADERDREMFDREHQLDRRRSTGQPPTAPDHSTARPDSTRAGERSEASRRRRAASDQRRHAAEDRVHAAAEWGPQEYGPTLVASFGDFARRLFSIDDLSDVLPQAVKFAVDAMAGATFANVTLWREGHVVDSVGTNVLAAELDELQFASATGPAVAAMQSDHSIVVPDLAVSPRWPVLAATAAQLGAASALCQGLFVHRSAQWSALGSLSIYSTTPDAFSDEDREFASILAAYISVAVATAQRRMDLDRREAALHRSLSTRDVIGQAKGILMERRHLTAGEAFDVLRRASQRLNRKLSDIAAHLAETGELAGEP